MNDLFQHRKLSSATILSQNYDSIRSTIVTVVKASVAQIGATVVKMSATITNITASARNRLDFGQPKIWKPLFQSQQSFFLSILRYSFVTADPLFSFPSTLLSPS
jgi:hypothetical protein